MSATESVTIDPGLSRAETQAAIQSENWKLLQYFNYYRLAIALSTATSFG